MFNIKKLSLWKLILPLLVCANLAYFIYNFLGWTITLGTFLFIPGYLFLNLLKHEIKSKWEIASFSLGLSLLAMMLGGLALNTLYVIGLKQPLTTINIFIMLNTITGILLFLNKKKTIKLPKITFSFNKEKSIFTAILSFLPFLAAGGAITLNNGGSNILTMILFALIPISFILLIWRKHESLYPYAILMMGLSILFTTSLRGWYVTGHDIHHEFYVFQLTNNNSFWPARFNSGDPYHACLSITILPTIIAKITTISLPYVFKFIFQVIFALGLLPMYFLIKKLSSSTLALIGGIIFISFPPFLNDMPFLNRQEIAFVFFGLLFLTNFLVMKNLPKILLTLLFLIGLILSHYSSNYVALTILLLSWGGYTLFRYIRKIKHQSFLPLLSVPVLLIGLLLTFFWNSVVTDSTIGLTKTIDWTVKGLINHSHNYSTGISYALFSEKAQDPNKILAKYVGNKANDVNYIPEQNLALTTLGKEISHILNVETLNKFIRAFSARILQIFLLLGLIVLFFKQYKSKQQTEIYFYILGLSCLFLLIAITLMPQLSVDYSVTRLFQQVLLIIALPIIVGAEFIFMPLKNLKVYAISVLFAFLFLHLSGLIPQLLGGYPSQLSLNNSGLYYDIYYIHKSELTATSWLNGEDNNLSIARDPYAKMRFVDYPFTIKHSVIPVLSDLSTEYLYKDYSNVKKGTYVNFLYGDLIEYKYTSDTETNGSLIYSNKQNQIFLKK